MSSSMSQKSTNASETPKSTMNFGVEEAASQDSARAVFITINGRKMVDELRPVMVENDFEEHKREDAEHQLQLTARKVFHRESRSNTRVRNASNACERKMETIRRDISTHKQMADNWDEAEHAIEEAAQHIADEHGIASIDHDVFDETRNQIYADLKAMRKGYGGNFDAARGNRAAGSDISRVQRR